MYTGWRAALDLLCEVISFPEAGRSCGKEKWKPGYGKAQYCFFFFCSQQAIRAPIQMCASRMVIDD